MNSNQQLLQELKDCRVFGRFSGCFEVHFGIYSIRLRTK